MTDNRVDSESATERYVNDKLAQRRPKNAAVEAANDPHLLGEAFLKKYAPGVLRFWRGDWWVYTGKHYVKMSVQELKARVTDAVKRELDLSRALDRYGFAQKVYRGVVVNVIQALEGLCLVPDDVEHNTWIEKPSRPGTYVAVENGIVDIDAVLSGAGEVLLPHSPAWFSAVRLPYEYDAAASCPRFEAFLDQMFEKDLERIQLIKEWFGYCLTPDTRHQKFLMLEGEGANGKSVLLEVLTALLDPQNVSHIPLEMFGDRFQLTPTLAKLANISTEVGEINSVAEGVLKGFTSGDRMYFDRKGVPGLQAYPTARLILATNVRPRFSDRSSGIWRRMILVPCQVTIPPEQQDKDLIFKLREELPGILNVALDGLRSLRARGGFIEPSVCQSALMEYREHSNPERQFIEERCIIDPKAEVPAADIFDAYREWCDEQGTRPSDRSVLGKEIGRLAGVERRRTKSAKGRSYIYIGLGLSQMTQVPQTSHSDEIRLEEIAGDKCLDNRDIPDAASKPLDDTETEVRH